MKFRTDHITNSSSSSFVCIKCKNEIFTWDWENDYERGMCYYCYGDLSQEDQEKVDNGTYINNDNVVSFIDYLCTENEFVDRNTLMNIYKEWSELR